MPLQFLRRGKIVNIDSFEPDMMLLDYLRLTEKSRGTKEGCNEGDCGACTVVLGEAVGVKMHYKAVNACILFLGQIHGKELITVEDLAEGGKLHPVQQAMVDAHASQCGFCTPGFVMSLFALGHEKLEATREDVNLAIAGNLCRCTGYRPIIEAGLKACNHLKDKFSADEAEAVKALGSIAQGDLMIGDEQRFFASPSNEKAFAGLVAKYPTARILAGGTDVGLWVTKQLRSLKQVIYTGRVRELIAIHDNFPPEASRTALHFGSAVTYAEAMPYLAKLSPDVGEVIRRIGSVQVRNSGTLGGNIANGSPIGDMPPMLIALDAHLWLAREGDGVQRMPLQDFFIDYGKQNIKPGWYVSALEIPKPRPEHRFKAFKISKRFDQDISAVMGAFRFTMRDDVIEEVRIAFGGMAATPKRASKTEATLKGKTLRQAMDVKLDDYAPISDMRASADYRRETAQGLLTKAIMELQGETETRVLA